MAKEVPAFLRAEIGNHATDPALEPRRMLKAMISEVPIPGEAKLIFPGLALESVEFRGRDLPHFIQSACCSVPAACAIGGARYLSSAEIASCSRVRMRSAEPEWTMLGLR